MRTRLIRYHSSSSFIFLPGRFVEIERIVEAEAGLHKHDCILADWGRETLQQGCACIQVLLRDCHADFEVTQRDASREACFHWLCDFRRLFGSPRINPENPADEKPLPICDFLLLLE